MVAKFTLKPSTEVVKLTYWAFAVWWVLILCMHILTCIYNLVSAYSYWKVQDPFRVGMPTKDHPTIGIVRLFMAVPHAVCILLMVGGSAWQRSLAFTPWASCNSDVKSTKSESERTRSATLQSLTKVYGVIADRHGVFGVNGDHFHAIHTVREVVETALQTVQAYRMSKLLSRTILNRFYVVLLVVNCWSSVIVNWFGNGDEARKRFVCIVLDCGLDLMASMGVEMIILLSYAQDYARSMAEPSYAAPSNDEWMARAFNEFQMVLIVSWSDLASRAFFSFGLVMATTNMKELLQRLPQKRNRVSQSGITTVAVKTTAVKAQDLDGQCHSISPTQPALVASRPGPRSFTQQYFFTRDHGFRRRILVLRAVHVMFGIWGIVILALHIDASIQPTLPQCLMPVKPWMTSRPSCYLAGLDCHVLQISGTMEEVDEKWGEFDSSTVVQLYIRHCPALEVPARFTEFHNLRGIKVYNTTIKQWDELAAVTNTNHPSLLMLYAVRVNFTDGLLPAGFQSTDFPSTVYDIELCVTNLRDVPHDLNEKWPSNAVIQVEYSQLTSVPLVLLQLQPYHFAVTGNPIQELPAEIFEVQSMVLLGISDTQIQELPHNVTKLSTALSWIIMQDTNISFFWSWADQLMERSVTKTTPWIAGGSTYCKDLAKIQLGAAAAFAVPLSPEYSRLLMDPSGENLGKISRAVDCNAEARLPSRGGLFYPLDYEDSENAISPPPTLVRQKYSG